MATKTNILLTGRPGIGKTTVITGLAEALAGHRQLGGFYTEEMRRAGQRQGFAVVTFSGSTGTLASIHLEGPHRVGRYGVDVVAFEKLVVPELAKSAEVMLVDEIGRMECFSARFAIAVRSLLDSPVPLVATVAARGAGLIAEVKARADIDLVEVTQQNRDPLPDVLMRRLGA